MSVCEILVADEGFPTSYFPLSGGLGSYTPSKIQMTEAPFQLGVSRNKSSATATTGSSAAGKKKETDSGKEVLRPIEDAVSWSGSSSSSDLLF